MARTRKSKTKINTPKSPLRSIESNNSIGDCELQAKNVEVTINPLRSIKTNNSVEVHELQTTNVEVTTNKRKNISNRTNAKKKKENEESHSINNNEIIQNMNDLHFLKSKNIMQQKEQTSNASSFLLRNNLSFKKVIQQKEQITYTLSSSTRSNLFYNKQLLESNISPSLSDRSNSSKSIYSERLLSSNIALSSLINYSFKDDQHQSISNETNISSPSLIRPFKNDLEVCLYLV
ncbi:hypothetical protein F8M41_002380 [Gigaspora margarita]|uniref:Uncharacterized protein n=1 Tax=Gigaspora margarita TaxID=4874 RepID=A0A8H3XCZ2_GIGMA|nr:hypothetical protein F8M41_002380 [Gigaspora margarita]